MCLTMYLAADVPLPLIPWQPEAPGLYVSDRVPELKAVRRHFSEPHVYVVGTHTGCGCGFMVDGVPAGGPEHAEVRSMYEGLAEYVRVNAAGQTVQIYSCWGGDEREDPELIADVGVDAIRREGFIFGERRLLNVHLRE